jgi:hypothetical protein
MTQRLLLAVALVALASRSALADGPQRRLSNTTGVSVNPIGVQDLLTLRWDWPLSRSKNPFFSDAHVALGATNHLSPAYDRVEAWIELSPLSVLDLKAGVEPLLYFGTFGHIVGFPGYDADFSRDARQAIKDQAVSRTGLRYHVSPTFKIRLGRVIVRSEAEFERWDVDGPAEFFYEPARDTLLRSNGDSLTVLTSQLLYEWPEGAGGRKVLAGAYHEIIDVHDAPANRRQRVGPLLLWTLGARRFGLREPTVVAFVGPYLEDRSKDGQIGGFVALSFRIGR